MDSVVQWFSSCFESNYRPAYQQVPTKKDDDQGVEAATDWKEAHKVRPGIVYEGEKAIQSYVTQIIKGLKKFPVTSSNKSLVQDHLVSIASSSNTVCDRLEKGLASCRGDQKVILDIRSQLAVTVTSGP